MRPALRQILLGGNSSALYVSSSRGSDNNSGRTPSSAFATIAKALTQIGAKTNQRLYLERGSVFREPIHLAVSGLSVDAFGSGANPQVLGSASFAGATWSLVTGTEYQTTLAYTPLNVFTVIGGVVTRLASGTSGSLTSGQWAVSGGKLHINIGSDPTGVDVEVPNQYSGTVEDPTQSGFYMDAVGQSVRNVDFLFWNISNVRMLANNQSVVACTASYGANDGIDGQGGADNCYIANCTIKLNGQGRTGTAGPGDGISVHDGSFGWVVEGNNIQDNDLTGIGNENSAGVLSRYNYMRNNNFNFRIYAGGSSTRGSHTAYYNKIAVSSADSQTAIRLEPLSPGGYDFVGDNNTCYFETNAAGSLGINCSSGDSVLRNNIVKGCNNGIANFNGFSSRVCTVDSDYNSCDVSVALYQSGFSPGTAGSHDKKETVTFTNAAGGDFTLQAGSNGKNTGTPLGFGRDFAGNAVSATTPSRGCYE